MTLFNAHIPLSVFLCLKKILCNTSSIQIANKIIFDEYKINNFFSLQEEFDEFCSYLLPDNDIVAESDRSEYGDFQTNLPLAIAIATFLKEQRGINPTILFEPTCGKGNFILAALQIFPTLEKIIGVEIHSPYLWEVKFNILYYYLHNIHTKKPIIELLHGNIFDVRPEEIVPNSKDKILILGNPPWVTNSTLSVLESANLPIKSNFKKHQGLDAITGKGNFDIGESVTLMMLNSFQHCTGNIAFLVKNSVIKNIIFDQAKRRFAVSAFEKYSIDCKQEFNVSVEASLFLCSCNAEPDYICSEYNFYTPETRIKRFGWIKNKFVSNIDSYKQTQEIDGLCPFEWRQGLKHDLSAIMELERNSALYINGYQQEIELEEDLLYGILKSSDLKSPIITEARKYTIVTQKKIGEDTSYIEHKYPKTYQYLSSHKHYFDSRKSSIYRGKPEFSIFGIGDYSFSPYKVAISGLYKSFSFSLILPLAHKPLMLDDTCYLLGFESLEFAAYTTILLNSQKATAFLRSITFPDAKRTFTKEVLMRINVSALAKDYQLLTLQQELQLLNKKYGIHISGDSWHDYLDIISDVKSAEQLHIF